MTSNDRVLMGLSIWVMDMVPVGMYNLITLITQIDSSKNLGLIYGSYGVIFCGCYMEMNNREKWCSMSR